MPHGHQIEELRFADPCEVKALEELQRRAALETADYREQILAHPDAIELPESAVRAKRVRVAVRHGEIAGFCTLLRGEARSAELDGLFVKPELFGSGIGRAMMNDAFSLAASEGISDIQVTANPRAIGFYEKLGFVGTGVVQTRFAPALRMQLSLPPKPPQRDIVSKRLHLKRVDLRDFEQYRNDAQTFMRKWGVTVAPEFENWLQPPERDATVAIEWNAYWMIHPETRTFMGGFGCRKFPNADGEVEIAYGIAPSFQNKGFATEVVRAAMIKLSEVEGVRTVIALTLPQENASTRVLSKCGFVRSGTAIDPDEGVVWKWSCPIARIAAGAESTK